MSPQGELPPDPFAAVEEANLQRAIDAVDWQKRERGVTWSGYLAGVIDLWELGDLSKQPAMAARLDDLRDMLPGLQVVESRDKVSFPAVKRQVIRNVQDITIIQRKLFDSSAVLKEENNG